jgi:hypothetical protein
MDSQIVELLGRNRLVEELLRARLEIALPIRDRGIDLVVYADLDLKAFVACPIQMKACKHEGYSLDAKYAKFPNLLLAYVWHIDDPGGPMTFAMTYDEALKIADEMGYTQTESWKKGYYTNTSPGPKLRELLFPHRMTLEKWLQKVRG